MGGILSDISIQQQVDIGALVVDPFEPEHVESSSLDVRLGSTFRVFDTRSVAAVDVRDDNSGLTRTVSIQDGEAFVLHPHEFALGHTLEIIGLSDNIAARLEGKSSLGRLGLLIHSTAGYIDPGFQGDLTLELSNVLGIPIKLYPGMLIGQISFHWMDQPVQTQYAGKYQGQRGPKASRFHESFGICDACSQPSVSLTRASIKRLEGEEWAETGESASICGQCIQDARGEQIVVAKNGAIPIMFEATAQFSDMRTICERSDCKVQGQHIATAECGP